jgi:hypothetical protein
MPDPPSPVVTYRKAQLRVAEVFFNGAGVETVDIVRHKFRASPISGTLNATSYTLYLNLENSPKYLLAQMSRATRSQIRRAEREGFFYEFDSSPTRNWAEEFFDFYDSFAQSKHLTSSLDRRRIIGLLSQGALDLSRICSPDGRVLVWHANLRSGRYACCLYSASLFRLEIKSVAAYIGRANRLHHWYDMLRFRDEGFAIYDFGGWYPGNQNLALLHVNCFKKSFGGELVRQYNCDQGITWKGALALWLRARVFGTQVLKTSSLCDFHANAAALTKTDVSCSF